MIRAIVFCGVILCAAPSGAAQKVYEGMEAAALRCADTMALTAVALFETGRHSEAEKEVLLAISVLILDLHVSGSWEQKKAALRVVRDRRDVDETLGDFQQFATQCLRQFPIN